MRSRLALPLIVFTLLLLIVAAVGTSRAATSTPGEVHTTATEHRSGERLKTIPISKQAWQKPRSVVSLNSARIGDLRNGDRLEAFGEVELSVCLKPNANHGGPGHPCIGKMYSYDPEIKARIVLAPSEGAAGPKQTMPVSAIETFLCTQKQPNRNHHCVVTVPWEGINIDDTAKLPCEPADCHLNLVVSAYHPQAKRGNLVVVGSNNDKAQIQQGKAKLSSVLYRGGKESPLQSWNNSQRVGDFPMAQKDGKAPHKVMYSLRLDNLREGDQLRVDARGIASISHLPYNALIRTQLILADGPRSVNHSDRVASKIADSTTRVSAENGFNCTLGSPSGFKSPCLIRKGGILSIRSGSPEPVYLNLIATAQAHGTEPMYNRWKPSDVVKTGPGWITAEKYRGSSACLNCKTGSSTDFIRFSPSELPPVGSKQRELVDELGKWGITQGGFQCQLQGQARDLVCRWSSKGSFGRLYECDSKAEWVSGHWKIKPCKDAIGAQLWSRLEKIGLTPTYAGSCDERSNSYVCRWFADGRWPSGVKYFCKGEATYSTRNHNWVSIDPCRS